MNPHGGRSVARLKSYRSVLTVVTLDYIMTHGDYDILKRISHYFTEHPTNPIKINIKLKSCCLASSNVV